jgi:N-acetyl-gamma-glutamyl-phosphate/LysW-gamma-L-alpha-aminoadipyl-6-phosphate reductase
MPIEVSVIGGSGYTGGELIRVLLRHPEVKIKKVTSSQYTGMYLHMVHPNMRKVTELKFSSREEVEPCDVLFTCVPHGTAMKEMEGYMKLGKKVVDLSADFRLHDPKDYPTWYEHEHTRPDLLSKFVYGIPELHREQIKTSNYVAGAGCLATASILGLYPLAKAGIIEPDRIIIDAKVGSSAAGHEPSLSSHHPERSHVVRLYAGTGHRHTGEIEQELNFGVKPTVAFTAHAIEQVRGISATSHVFIKEELHKTLQEKDIWKTFRKEYENEPFMRLVKDKKGVFRYPEPKILLGTNFCDVGFEVDPHTRRLVVVSAIDNLMKGAAGAAVQCMNLMNGFPETTGLDAIGFHPI